eukprot:2841335-Amphidinium_carterae.2
MNYIFRTATLTCIIMPSQQIFLKMMGLASGHTLVSPVETFGSFVLPSAVIIDSLVEYGQMTLLNSLKT